MEVEAKGKAEDEEGIQEKIPRAMRARLSNFKEQADSLTLEGVRRALEKDLGMKTFELDAQKRFIKQCLEECFYGPDDADISKKLGENSQRAIQLVKEEIVKESEGTLQEKELEDPSTGLDEKVEGSQTMDGVDTSACETQDVECGSDLREDIKKAINKRASYFRANSENITLLGVRRLLEEDLKLEKRTLDAYKSLISKQLDEVFLSPEVVEPTNGVKKQLKKNFSSTIPSKRIKGSKEVSRSDSEDASDTNETNSEDEEVDEEQIKPKKKVAQKVKTEEYEERKKHKRPIEDSKPSGSVKKKRTEAAVEKAIANEDVGNSSEDGHSHLSAEEGVKKKRETSTQVYGKRVEHLKSIIKACGMGVPPSVYKRAKQVPENKRESYLIKELEDILGREGLSTDPFEKEIKAVKKKKERAKELEGIDMSNIVSSTRRRTSSNFLVPPPKPKISVESDEDDEEDSDDDNSDSGGSSDGTDEVADEESGSD